jgi:hypothetical protein
MICSLEQGCGGRGGSQCGVTRSRGAGIHPVPSLEADGPSPHGLPHPVTLTVLLGGLSTIYLKV